MTRLVRIAMALVAMALPVGLSAQGGGTITGQVLDASNQRPVQEAQVFVVGTQRGASTDQQGRYSITNVPAGSYEVRARRVGYAPGLQRVTVGAGVSAAANFALATSAAQLEEVVVNAVTGQVQRRVEVGTNTGYIDVAALPKGPITKMADVLQGRVAGVNLQSAAGATGSSQRVRIRGANSLSLSNEPLLYVDGILVSNSKGGIGLGGQDYSRLNDINPEEIENIEILKGPAASAIYGSAASVGVILISTKRGRAGKPVWRGYVEGGRLEDKNDYPSNYIALSRLGQGDVYDIEQGGVLNTRNLFGGTTRPYQQCPNFLAALASGTPGACVQDTVLSFNQLEDSRTTPFQNGQRGKVGLSISGGSEALTFFISGDQERENGVLRPNDLERVSFRTNLNARIGSKANAAITAAYITSDSDRFSGDNNIFSPLINGFLGTAQYLPGMESDTVSKPGSRLGSYFGYNTADQRLTVSSQSVDRYIVGANTQYNPLSWLRLNGNVGVDYFGRYDRQTLDPNILPLALDYVRGFRDGNRSRSYQYTSNASGTATFSLTPSLVSNTTGGVSYLRTLFESIGCYGIGIPAGTESCSAATSQFSVSEGYSDAKTFGLFGRQELAFADRFFVAGTLRADNNSGLIREVSGLAVYPSLNASWVLSKEPFFPTIGFLSQLRLRAGYGQAGQRPGFGDAETFFASRAVQIGGAELPALILTRTGNSALKVERTTEIEGGFDASFFSDRFSTEFTAFTRRSVDALISRNLAPSSGLTGAVFQNIGSIRNWGTETALRANLVDASKFRFDARLTATTLRNRIEDLALDSAVAPIQFNRGAQAHRQDFPTGAFFARPIKYDDADKNGKLSRAEVTVDTSKFLAVRNIKGGLDTLNVAYVGPALPTNTQGLSGDVTLFGAFTISALFERRAGNKQLNFTEFFRCRTQGPTAIYSQCGALSNPNASLESQAAYIGAQFLSATPFGYIEDADFIKWRELSVRVGVPESISSKFSALEGAAISLSGRNLKTWTDYSGIDPEINEGGGSSNFGQGEFNTQPPVRTFTLRFDFKL
ncbi:MAG: SusC/RagA family TonB-linked outer membrane protein [Gemmatimonadaceae bacterium]